MRREQTHNLIKSTVASFLPDAKVFLFGSRSRGDFKSFSDYDVLIITKKTFHIKEKIGWESRINRALVYSLDAPFDVIVQSEEEVDVKKNYIGHIVHYALKDAVEI